ncbi:OmpA family protein [Methylibium rhizosphaerae]|uniref:OmpA family protein n=1 Tax=Methylibium rhizosphaerae TaxID=2570323 RepID=UPI00112B836D|nr:OmpA family protein [Methylibium rhizosphaerae]
MSVRRGISILDLLPQTTGVATQIPDGIVEQIGILTVLDHRSTTSNDFFLHEGTLQSLADALDINTAQWLLRIPGLTHGLPFRLAVNRALAANNTAQEGAPGLWTLDIEVWDVEVLIPGVRAARKTGGTGVTPLTLQPTGNTPAQQQVHLVAQGVVRISGGPGATPTQVQLVDAPDPFDPTAPTGSVIRLTAKPSSFLFGSSQYGMTLDSVVLDLSQNFTPADIEARGHDETWEGVSYKEATFYFPPDTPLVHSLSVSTRDVIIGSPGGLQGELALEFGQDFNDVFNTRLTIKQYQSNGTETDVAETTPAPRGTALQYAITTGPGDTPQRVRAVFAVGDDQFVPGHTDLAVKGVWWKLPDGTEGNTASTPWFNAPTTNLLRYRLRVGDPAVLSPQPSQASAIPNQQRELMEVNVSFPRQAGSPSGIGPMVDATVGATTFNNVLHLRGPRERLQGVVLTKRGGGNVAWRMGTGSAPVTVPAANTFTIPAIAQGTTSADVVVIDTNGQRRIRVEVVPQGPLAVGHQVSSTASSPAVVTVVGTDGGDATPTSVVDTFLARPFHVNSDRASAPTAATIAGTQVTVPAGTDAEVEVPIPRGDADPLPVPVPVVTNVSRVVQMHFDWDSVDPLGVLYPYTGSDTTNGVKHEQDAWPLALHFDASRDHPDGTDATSRLRNWINALGTPSGTRKFYVVGRTDDLKYNATEADNNSYNNDLADRRANAAKTALINAGVPTTDIIVRHETEAFASPPPVVDANTPPPRIIAVGRLALPASRKTHPSGATLPVWNSSWNPDAADWTTHMAARNDANRPPYRCAEIYAADSGAAPAPAPAPAPANLGVPTRMLVPGPDGAPPAGLSTTNTAPPPTDYRVRLRAKWDSPTVVSVADAIPTEAEALVAWKKAAIELPPSASGNPPAIPAPPPSPPGQDFWEILLRWAYDARTGQTEASGALSLPDGAVNISSDALAGALAFGPAITALANPADAINDPLGQFVAAAAILAVGAAIGELINTGGGPASSVDLDKVAISYKWNGAPRVSATVDYTVDLRVNVSVAGAGSLVGHLRMKYKAVGLRFDGAPGGGLSGVALTYDSMSVEVVDPGTWSLGGPLGNLIRIAASRMGNGSQWMEFDLEFALNLGVVRLEGATIRLGLEPFKVEFRGLTASVDIPATLKGKGSVTIGDGGSFRALMALEVIPAKLSAYGSLAVDQDFVAVEVGVQLPVGIPLGGTGFGIFGFMGRFVANGTRNTNGLSNADPVQKQLGWYALPPQDKYKRKSGQFAFGVGAVIGTLPDGAFTFNAEGSLTIGFPDVSVIFGIDAHLISQRKSQATEQGTANNASMRILGMVLIEPDSIMLAVRASYEIPKVLKLEIPISAFFPLAGGLAWYIRIGTDNDATRPGSPVTITLLPGTLDVRAWAFVLIEERQLHHLGGTLVPADLNIYPLDFDGFSIGMGAGFDLKWEAGPFSLEVTAFLLVGMGTKPLLFAGAAGIKGELDLVVISVGVDGMIHFHISDDYNYIEGHFCGHVDLFFFEVSGCVDIRIGDDPPLNIPEPESPLLGLDLCDHLACVKGKASRKAAEEVPVVWPDTVAVLRCSHYVEDGLGAGSDFDRKLISPAALSPWNGSTELKYAYRLKTLALWKLTGGDPSVDGNWTKISGPFDSAWWMPTHRKAIIENSPDAIPPSTEEGRELGLFSWDPRAWSRWLGEGAQNVPGDPAQTVEDICEENSPADPSCAYGKGRVHSTGNFGLFKATPAAGSAFPSRFNVVAHLPNGLDVATLVALGADAGWTWLPGAVVPLHGGIVHHGVALSEGWRFPSWRKMGQIMATAPMSLTPSKPLIEGEVVLEVCLEQRDVPTTQPGGCDSMPAQDGSVGGFTGQSGTKYEGVGKAFDAGGERALALTQHSLFGSYPGAIDAVSADLDPVDKITVLTAFAADGSMVGQARTQGPGRQWLRVEGAGIVRMSIKADAEAVVYKVCWGHAQHLAIAELIQLQILPAPQVIATNSDGKVFVLTGEPVDMPPPTATVVVARCPKLRYVLPKGSTQGAGWTNVQIAPWSRGDVALVAFCGVTLEAAQAQAHDTDYRGSLQGLLLELIQAAADNKPTHQVYLDANQLYEIRADWQYQGFRPAHPGDEPPATSSGTWKDASKQDRFRFHTANFGLAVAPALAQNTSLDVDPAQGGPGYDERTFDPRGLSRYVTQVQPTHEDPPHFLDDHVGFWFMVDHLQPLVEKYDRILQVKVLHTRPDVGSLHASPLHIPGDVHILDVTVSVNWAVDTLAWFPADYRFIEASAAAPCINGAPAVGSSSVSVKADLEPLSEYDLLLNVAPKTVNASSEVAVARSHFRTSRYRNPTEMLRALGFAPAMGLMAPNDAIAAAPLASGSLQVGDTELDAALTTLGLDPWPLPAGPRTTAIWLRPASAGQPWKLAGILVEADEPVHRAGFKTGAQGETEPSARLEVKTLQLFKTYEKKKLVPHFPGPFTFTWVTTRDALGSLTERVRNAAGTRCIFVPTTPIEVMGGRLYDLELQFKENGSDGALGRLPLFDRPLIVAQEGA